MEEKDPWISRLSTRATLAVSITCIFGWLCTLLAVMVPAFLNYAFGLFIWLPMVMGFISTLIYGYRPGTKRSTVRNVAYAALGIYCFGLLLFALEGVGCLIMAFPLGLLSCYIGFVIGYVLIKKKLNNNTPATIIILLLSVPAFMAFEKKVRGGDDTRSITTSIIIDAPPEVVWKNVIGFPKLAPPKEFVFKAGIAYPTSATIDGQGVGVIRHCNFSTGSFTEPITEWKEPSLLRFNVFDQPETMKEISFYNIHPTHLKGYFVSKQGQFKLTRLPDGKTLLEGTTWYINKIKPGFYWNWWSDMIVHKIHDRVLQHIKQQAEATH